MHTATFRFYAELNDFLPATWRRRDIPYRFFGTPGVKDAIEALGVPHVEVDIVLANGHSVGLDYRLHPGDRIAVYPVFESLDITPLVRLHGRPLRDPKFVVDIHLGKLARLLRLLGFDTVYDKGLPDEKIVLISESERRIILTRDRDLLKRGAVTHGYWVRSTDSLAQAREVVQRFDLHARARPFTRCPACNGLLTPVTKEEVLDRIPPKTARWQDEYFMCTGCGKLYWRGTHYPQLQKMIERITERK